MFSYLVLALTVTFVLSNHLETPKSDINGFQGKDILREERYLKEKSNELLRQLIHILKTAYSKGSEAFNQVFNDPDVQAILERMDGLTRRIAESIITKFKELIEKIDNATKPTSAKRDLKESSTELMKRLVQILLKAYKKGTEYFNQVVNDPDVQGILEHLGPLTRRVADSLIKSYRELLEKIDEITKEPTPVTKRGVIESSRSMLNRLVQILIKASRKGSEYFNQVLNDPDVQGILEHLEPLTRRVAESIINSFKELVNKIDEATKEPTTVEKRGLKDSSTDLMKRLIQILLKAQRKGLEYFNQVINDPDVQGILEHLAPLSRKIADSIIENLRQLLEKIDEATKEPAQVQTRGIKESSREMLNRLVQILLKAYKQGIVYFDQVVNDPDVQEILKHLGPLSRKVAESMIESFRQLLEKIDEATKETTTLEKRDFKESSWNLLKKLVHILVKAYEKGSSAFNKALNDPDVKAILNSLDNISRKTAEVIIAKFKELIIKIDNATNDKVSVSERDLKETVTAQMKRLIQILIKASKKGSEYFYEVINDPDVKAIREHLDPLRQKIITGIINKFKELFDKIDNATKEKNEVKLMSDWQEESKVQLKRFVQILLKAYRKGGEYFDKVINDPDVRTILEHLGPLSRKIANSIIETFKELIEKLDNATKEVPQL